MMNKSHSNKNSGLKYDGEKPDYSLVPFEALDEIVKVLTFGAKKYGRENWHMLDNLERRYFSACMRHLSAYGAKKQKDPETGLHHLAHAGCCVLFMLWKEIRNEQRDRSSLQRLHGLELKPEESVALREALRAAIISGRRKQRKSRTSRSSIHSKHAVTGRRKYRS